MGCEHERIHLETSSVLFRQLPLEHVKVPALLPMMWSPSAQFRSERSQVPRNTLVPVRGGMVVAGNSSERHRVYGWDLEYGTHVAEVGSFSAAKFLVSNAEFFEFVQEGGYEDQSLWGEEGAKFVAYRNAKHPVFWRPLESSDEEEPRAPSSSEEEDGGISASSKALSSPPRFLYRSMTTEMSMPWDWPVDVNYIEAKAFCAWKNRQRAERGEDKDGLVYRLPTEDEYFRLRDQFFPADIEVVIDERTGERARVPNDQPDWHTAPGNINLEHGASSCPVDRFAFPPVAVSSSSSSDPAAAAVTEAGKAEDQEDRLYDVVGNVWQWTETPLMPFRGFRFHPMYDDFSVPTFDTRHNVIVGGSWISTGNEATRTARFAFRRHFYQHAGFRYILAPPLREGNNAPQQNMCETDPAVVAMMDAQFNDAAQVALARNLHMQPQPNYAARIAQIAFEAYKNYGTTGTPLVADDALGAAAASATGERNGASSSSSSPAPTTLASPGPRALDIGCACGRSTFELAKLAAARGDGSAAAPVFNHILGLDFSTRFIRIAAQLQFEGHAEYSMAKEGNLLSYHSIESQADAPPAHMLAAGSDAASSSSSSSSATAAGAVGRVDLTVSTAPSVLDLDLARLGMRHRVEFLQGDACNLASKYTGFDLVLASNLLEFLYTPRLFLEGIGARMRRGGILVLSSSYGWSEQEGGTPKDHWLGGFKDATGESVDSARAIADILTAKDAFEPIHAASQELPVIWKQNQRHYALRFAHVTVWRKK
jgi:formylglycine-generating enzyme required for sulfatase activity/SAM-dependent methyltransferase